MELEDDRLRAVRLLRAGLIWRWGVHKDPEKQTRDEWQASNHGPTYASLAIATR